MLLNIEDRRKEVTIRGMKTNVVLVLKYAFTE